MTAFSWYENSDISCDRTALGTSPANIGLQGAWISIAVLQSGRLWGNRQMCDRGSPRAGDGDGEESAEGTTSSDGSRLLSGHCGITAGGITVGEITVGGITVDGITAGGVTVGGITAGEITS